MMNLQLYKSYTRDEIFAVFGNPHCTEAEGWFLSSNRLLGLFAIAERSPDTHFCDNSRFHWHSQPDEPVPQPLQHFKNLEGAHLFIKSPMENRYVYVARIRHVGMHGSGRDRSEAAMDIDPRIPTELLHKLGGLYINPDGEHAMNGPIAALRAAETPGQRFAAFKDFVESWRGPLEHRHALSELELSKSPLPIPTILSNLYGWAGACDDVMHAGYLSIRKPEKLSVNDDGYVAFCVECQWCGNYYVRKDALQEADPEVFADECGDTRDGAGYHATGISLSKFLWAYYIAFNIYGGPISYQVELKRDEYQRLKEIIAPLPLLVRGNQSCRGIQAYRSKIGDDDDAAIFAADGVMGTLTKDEHSSQMLLLSKTQHAVDEFIAKLHIEPSRLSDSI
jgi:hypothetical protein